MNLWAEMDGDARRAACLKGRTAGLSAAQIAKPLGCTRMAVIGILKRLKDSGVRVPASPHGKGSNPAKRAITAAAVPEKKPEPKPARVHGAGAASAARARMVPAENRAALPVERTLSGPISRNLSLMDLSDTVCRYPHGDPKLPSFGFCGAATNGTPPYCRYHARLIYQPPEVRRHKIATATLSTRAA
jgi:GcrA cell cycle regulator